MLRNCSQLGLQVFRASGSSRRAWQLPAMATEPVNVCRCRAYVCETKIVLPASSRSDPGAWLQSRRALDPLPAAAGGTAAAQPGLPPQSRALAMLPGILFKPCVCILL